MDGMSMEWSAHWDTLSHDDGVNTCASCMSKNVWGFLVYTLLLDRKGRQNVILFLWSVWNFGRISMLSTFPTACAKPLSRVMVDMTLVSHEASNRVPKCLKVTTPTKHLRTQPSSCTNCMQQLFVASVRGQRLTVLYTDRHITRHFFSCKVRMFNDVQSHHMAQDEPLNESVQRALMSSSCKFSFILLFFSHVYLYSVLNFFFHVDNVKAHMPNVSVNWGVLLSGRILRRKGESADRKQAYHTNDKRLLPAQSFFAHLRTEKPVHELTSQEIQSREIEIETIRILLENTQKKFSLILELRFENTNFKQILFGEVSRNWMELSSLSEKKLIMLLQNNFDEINFFFQNNYPNKIEIFAKFLSKVWIKLKNWSDFNNQDLTNFREEDRSKIKTSLVNSRPEFRKFRITLILKWFEKFSRCGISTDWIIFLLQVFRNSIHSETDFYCLWRSNMMTSWKDCTNWEYESEELKTVLEEGFWGVFPTSHKSRVNAEPSSGNATPQNWTAKCLGHNIILGNVIQNPTATFSIPNQQKSNPWISAESKHTSPHGMSEMPIQTYSQKFSHPKWGWFFKELWDRPTTTADFRSSFWQFPLTNNVRFFFLENKIQDRGMYLFTISYGSYALDQRSGDRWFSGWFKIFVICKRNSNARFEVLDARIASAPNRLIHNFHFKRRVSLEEQNTKKRTVSFVEDRSLTWSTSTSGSLEPTIPSRTMPTYLLFLFEMTIFRNSIRNGMEFFITDENPIWWHLGRIAQIKNTSLRNSRPCWNCMTWRFIRRKQDLVITDWRRWWKEVSSKIYETGILGPETEIMKETQWLRIIMNSLVKGLKRMMTKVQ